MKTLKSAVLLFTALLSLTKSQAQIKNAKTENVKVYGNCEMCKKTIESAANKKGSSKAIWNADSKMLSLTYNSTKTSSDEILKRIAYAGYDNERFMAPNDAYSKLIGCCQYERMKTPEIKMATNTLKNDMPGQDTTKKVEIPAKIVVNPLGEVYSAYFALKDALTKDDGAVASVKAKELFTAIDKVETTKMNATQHPVWMKYQQKLSYDAEHIKGVTETEHQREHLISLSKNMYEVMKVFKMDVAVYYDFCPMANNGKGANWLSLQQPISNPYFGKQMPTCGKVQETIAK